MSGRIQKPKAEQTAKVEEAEAVEAKDEQNQQLADDVSDILDEIDSVLEENAQEFVAGFIQKGGE